LEIPLLQVATKAADGRCTIGKLSLLELVKLAEEKFKTIQEAYEEARRVKGF